MLYPTTPDATDLETAIELLRVVRWADKDEATFRAATAGISVLRRALAEQRLQELFTAVTRD